MLQPEQLWLQFVSLDESIDIEQIISDEKLRREEVYDTLRKTGPVFISNSYGTLTLNEDNTFEWKNYGLLVPSIITRKAKGEGEVEIKYFLPSSLKSEWDGVLTLHFTDMKEEVNFLYKRESNGLCFALANVNTTVSSVTGRSSSVVNRPSSSLVIFFQD